MHARWLLAPALGGGLTDERSGDSQWRERVSHNEVAPDPGSPASRWKQGAIMGTTHRPTTENGTPSETGVAALELRLPCSAEAPGLARRAIQRWMAGLRCTEEFVEDTILIVSEAVTNAVVHACSQPRLVVTVVEDRLRVEVHDTSRDPPVMRPASVAVGGLGLRIVASVANEWGWSMTPTGKVVWSEQHLAGPRRCHRDG